MNTTKKNIKLEKAFFFCLSRNLGFFPKKVYIIGCGGNGSYLVPALSRMTQKSNMPSIVLIDGDKVEPKNLTRQNFVEQDIGKNKAEVLSSRYSCLNSQISFYPEMFKPEHIKSSLGLNVLVTCTDTFASRREVEKVFLQSEPCIWLDLGNEKFGGQVILSANLPTLGSVTPLPTLFELFPEIDSTIGPSERNNSCADLTEQAGYVNLTAATVAANFMWALLNEHPIFAYMVRFSIDNVYETNRITQSKLEEWKAKIPRLQR